MGGQAGCSDLRWISGLCVLCFWRVNTLCCVVMCRVVLCCVVRVGLGHCPGVALQGQPTTPDIYSSGRVLPMVFFATICLRRGQAMANPCLVGGAGESSLVSTVGASCELLELMAQAMASIA